MGADSASVYDKAQVHPPRRPLGIFFGRPVLDNHGPSHTNTATPNRAFPPRHPKMQHPPSLSTRLIHLLEWMGFWRGGVRREMFGDLAVPGLTPREVTIYLPPNFRPGRRAPLLVALDGQTMPQWRLAPALRELVETGAIEPPVVLAVPASAERIDEYGAAGVLDFAGRGRLAARFQNYLAFALLPAVRARYGAGLEPAQTGVFGASMGGLCAFDTAWRHPEVFGFAGIFSGSLWWRSDDSSAAAQQASRLMHRRVRELIRKPPLRLWFQAGTADEMADRDGNGVIDAIQDTTELIDELVAGGFNRGDDVVYTQTPGGEHHEATWALELPGFLRWALPPRR
jgi:enterochelin esterase-like enzyme